MFIQGKVYFTVNTPQLQCNVTQQREEGQHSKRGYNVARDRKPALSHKHIVCSRKKVLQHTVSKEALFGSRTKPGVSKLPDDLGFRGLCFPKFQGRLILPHFVLQAFYPSFHPVSSLQQLGPNPLPADVNGRCFY